MSKNTIGILYMVVATFGWGLSFLLNKNLLEALPRNTLMTYRFAIGCLFLGIVFWKTLRTHTNLRTIGCAFVIGLLLYLNMFFTFKALETTDSGLAGVIMGSSIIWTQLVQALVQRRLPSPTLAVAARSIMSRLDDVDPMVAAYLRSYIKLAAQRLREGIDEP